MDEYPNPIYCAFLSQLSAGLLTLVRGDTTDGLSLLKSASDISLFGAMILESNFCTGIYAPGCVDAARVEETST